MLFPQILNSLLRNIFGYGKLNLSLPHKVSFIVLGSEITQLDIRRLLRSQASPCGIFCDEVSIFCFSLVSYYSSSALYAFINHQCLLQLVH